MQLNAQGIEIKLNYKGDGGKNISYKSKRLPILPTSMLFTLQRL